MAASTSVLEHVCPAMLLAYSEMNRTNNPLMKITPVGFMQALMDPDNRTAASIIPVDSGNGHVKQVRIKYMQRSIAADTDTEEDDCSPGESGSRPEQLFAVEQYRKIKFEFPEEEVRNLCEGASILEPIAVEQRTTSAEGRRGMMLMNDFMKRLNGGFDGIRSAINSDLLTSQLAQVGAFADQPVVPTAPYAIPMLKTIDGAPVMKGINEWQQQILLNQIYGKPIVVALGNFNRFNNALKCGCCNAGGTDFGKMDDMAMYKYYMDRQIDSLYGDNQFLTLAPGAAQLVTVLKNRGSFAGMIGTKSRSVVPDPVIPGLAYDISIMPNECDNSYTCVVGLHFDLWTPPADAYKAGDILEDTNGILLFEAQAI